MTKNKAVHMVRKPSTDPVTDFWHRLRVGAFFTVLLVVVGWALG